MSRWFLHPVGEFASYPDPIGSYRSLFFETPPARVLLVLLVSSFQTRNSFQTSNARVFRKCVFTSHRPRLRQLRQLEPRCLSEAMCCDAHRGSNGHLVEGGAIHGSLAKQQGEANTNGWDRWRPMETVAQPWHSWHTLSAPVDASVHLMSWWCDSNLSHVLIWQCRKHSPEFFKNSWPNVTNAPCSSPTALASPRPRAYLSGLGWCHPWTAGIRWDPLGLVFGRWLGSPSYDSRFEYDAVPMKFRGQMLSTATTIKWHQWSVTLSIAGNVRNLENNMSRCHLWTLVAQQRGSRRNHTRPIGTQRNDPLPRTGRLQTCEVGPTFADCYGRIRSLNTREQQRCCILAEDFDLIRATAGADMSVMCKVHRLTYATYPTIQEKAT